MPTPTRLVLTAASLPALVVGAWLSLSGGAVWAGPAEGDVTQEQLEYAKQLFAQAEEAMKAKDFDTAVAQYKEAYRYAPHLHLFTYNIATAAEAGGDCKTAHYYYGMFLARVPEHPERKTVEKKVEQLQIDCPYDNESEAVVSEEVRGARDEQRADQEKDRVMNKALAELEASQRMYTAAASRHKNQKAFKAAARCKKHHAKRMKKLLKSHGVAVESADASTPTVAEDPKKACRNARAQEKRTITALEGVLEQWDTAESYRVIGRFMRRAENRDLPAFDECS